MLALAVFRLKSRLKLVTICSKTQSYQLTNYLLAFCLHKINTFYTAY